MNTFKIYQVIRELDDTNFKYLRGSTSDRFQCLHDNLWSMFDIEKVRNEMKRSAEGLIECIEHNKCEPEISVSNFGWTKEVEEKFFKHPKHRYFMNKWKVMHRDMTWGMWCLNSLPSTVE